MAFVKGQSGNPGGRPKDTVRPLAVSKSKAAFAKLVKLMDSSDENISLKASIYIIERAFGKPIQEIEGSIDLAGKVKLVTPQDRLSQNRVFELTL